MKIRYLASAVLCDAAALASHLLDVAVPLVGPIASRRSVWCYDASITLGRVERRAALRREAAR